MNSRRKIPVKILYSGGGVHTRKENVYLCTYANFILLFVLFVTETSPGVQFVTASLGNVVTDKDNIYENCVICPEDAQSRKNKTKQKKSCVVFNMDSECFFYFWVYKKRSKTRFCHCCSVSVEYEYCVLLSESRKQRSKK